MRSTGRSAENRLLVTVPNIGGTIDWNPTNDTFVTEGPEESGMVDIRSATTGESILSWRGNNIDINDVEYSADGTMLAVAGDGGVLKVFDPSDGSLISTVVGGGEAVGYPSFSADGTRLLAKWTDEEKLRTVDPATGATLAEFDANIHAIEISPDGIRAIVGLGGEPSGAIFDDGSTDPVLELTERKNRATGRGATAAAWSPREAPTV